MAGYFTVENAMGLAGGLGTKRRHSPPYMPIAPQPVKSLPPMPGVNWQPAEQLIEKLTDRAKEAASAGELEGYKKSVDETKADVDKKVGELRQQISVYKKRASYLESLPAPPPPSPPHWQKAIGGLLQAGASLYRHRPYRPYNPNRAEAQRLRRLVSAGEFTVRLSENKVSKAVKKFQEAYAKRKAKFEEQAAEAKAAAEAAATAAAAAAVEAKRKRNLGLLALAAGGLYFLTR